MPRKGEMETDSMTGLDVKIQVRLSEAELDRCRQAAKAKQPKAWSLQKFARQALLEACEKAGE